LSTDFYRHKAHHTDLANLSVGTLLMMEISTETLAMSCDKTIEREALDSGLTRDFQRCDLK